jgi:hypothetical protein
MSYSGIEDTSKGGEEREREGGGEREGGREGGREKGKEGEGEREREHALTHKTFYIVNTFYREHIL